MATTLLSDTFEIIVNQYQKEPANRSLIEILRTLRQELANYWLNLPSTDLEAAYIGDIGKAHKILLHSGIKDEPVTVEEANFIDPLMVKIAQGFNYPKAISCLLAVMLYRRADTLPLFYQAAPIPRWFFDDFIRFILDFPCYFQEVGDVEQYAKFTQNFVHFIYQNILENPTSDFWQKVALLFANESNFVPLYFCETNLKQLYCQRGDILEIALKNLGHSLDYQCPQRLNNSTKIRIGILKGDFAFHPESFTTLPIFEYLDREKFEIILYVTSVTNNSLEEYSKTRCDQFIHLTGELREQVARIREDNLDILFVGSIVTNSLQRVILLSLHRLARIQMTYFASPVTTGFRNIDYFISGTFTENPETSAEHYREKLICLEGTGFCFNYQLLPAEASIQPTRKSLGIAEDAIVYISGANLYKITPELRETWAKIIAAVPNAILVLYPFSKTWKRAYPRSAFTDKMRAIFTQHGLQQNQLIVLQTLPSRSDVKECLKLADVYLDSFPYSGANSTVDPLEVGLPTVVRDGDFLRSRQGGAILRSLQLSDLIAEDEASYIQLAIALGKNADLRQKICDRIQQAMQQNPSFLESRHYSAQLGALFENLVKNHL